MYKYLNIRFDSKYSQFVDTEHLLHIVSQLDYFKKIDKLQFENNQDMPWGVLTLIKCDDRGCFAFFEGDYHKEINLIELIFKDEQKSFDHYLKIAKEIAIQIAWEVEDEETKEVIVKK